MHNAVMRHVAACMHAWMDVAFSFQELRNPPHRHRLHLSHSVQRTRYFPHPTLPHSLPLPPGLAPHISPPSFSVPFIFHVRILPLDAPSPMPHLLLHAKVFSPPFYQVPRPPPHPSPPLPATVHSLALHLSLTVPHVAGRGGNTWESPEGCLMFSLSLRWIDGRTLPLLQYVLSLAVVQAIEDMAKERGVRGWCWVFVCARECLKQTSNLLRLPLLQYVLSLAVVQAIDDMAKERGTSLPQVALKWPNDIFLGGLKVGGVLCTSSYRNRAFDVTVGIGLNVDNAQPTTCINAALQAACPSAAPVSHEALLAALLNRLHSLLTVFQQQGFKPLEADYLQRWLHSGQHVVLEEPKDGGGTTQVSLTIQGLTTGGYLLATDPSGAQYELSPDGNSLDFFKGLMRRKLNPEEQVAGRH
ncbi:unnamed protein product [Closterium sp. Naga37s-1]|nr:unnamed protein product [Closterium sp. Naga37s-1]